MPRSFSPATAEQVVAVVEAAVVGRQPVRADFVAEFSDLTVNQTQAALDLATDLGLLTRDGQRYSVASPLCRFIVTPNQMQKASILRVVLESYEPFLVFRERLAATGLASTAAQQSKAGLGLDAHREEIKDTLVSLGTYSHALITEGGGRYRPQDNPQEHTLLTLAQGSGDLAAAEARVREQIGPNAAALVSREEVIVPISNALIRARDGDARGAVVDAGNAIESFLAALGQRVGVPAVAGAPGINAKLDRLSQANKLPTKLVHVGKYLGHVRNAADHGVDPEVGVTWNIRPATGIECVFVACSFIAASVAHERGRPAEI